MNIELIQVQKYGKYDDGNDTVDENKKIRSNLEEGNNGDNENFEDSSNHTSEI